MIEGLKTDKDLYQIIGWVNPIFQFQPCPIKNGDKILTTPNERADYLRKSLLERTPTTPDLTEEEAWATKPETEIPWNNSITPGEARAACCDTGNTTPGADNITVHMLKAAWEHVGEPVRLLLQRCLGLGYHPQPFRRENVVMIPKPSRDLGTAKGWRPIALPSCI